jgi:hypothetical protein
MISGLMGQPVLRVFTRRIGIQNVSKRICRIAGYFNSCCHCFYLFAERAFSGSFLLAEDYHFWLSNRQKTIEVAKQATDIW